VVGLTVGPVFARRVVRRIRPRRAQAALRARRALALERCDRLPVRRPANVRVETIRIGRAPPA
jgi:hypothetical protein